MAKRTKRVWTVYLKVEQNLLPPTKKLATAREIEKTVRDSLSGWEPNFIVKNVQARDRAFDRKHGRDDE